MRLSLNLFSDHYIKAEALKQIFYPATPSAKLRPSYVYQTCIAKFQENDPESLKSLKEYILKDTSSLQEYIPRQVNLQAHMSEKLKKLAATLSSNTSATLRALILYWLDHQASAQPLDEDLLSMIQALDQDIENLHTRVDAIRKLIENSKNK